VPKAVPVVYVDSASTDDSVKVAQIRGAEIVELDLKRPFTAARARNEGFERLLQTHPKIRYIQFVDGDCEFEEDWLLRAHAFLEGQPGVAAVCGRRRERDPDASFYNKIFNEEWDTPIGRAHSFGGDVLVRVNALTAVGGYDPALIAGEEPELCSRMRQLGWVVWRLDFPMTIHDAAMHRFSQWWRRALRSGYGYAQVWHKTHRSPGGALFKLELGRALVWVCVVPATAVALAFFWGPAALLAAPLLWAAQLIRLSIRDGLMKGLHLMVGKVAEALGAARYALAVGLGRQKTAIYYK
jgi:glycosyltransferase involved in cell wall biosynthesis